MNPFWSKLVHQLSPYVPGEQPQIERLIKLNTNENPYGPSPKVLEAIRLATGDALRLYPDPNATALRTAIANKYGISASEVFVGNGSDEVLALAFLALLKHDAPLLFPDITYSFYPVYAQLYGIDYRTVPLDDEYRIRVSDYLGTQAGAVIVANPNAPTGRALGVTEVEQLVAGLPGQAVVIDEAYVDFGGTSAVPLVRKYPNLLVVQTLSKSRALAGLRVGFAIGQPELVEALERVKNCFNSYPLDRLAIAGGVAAIEDEAYFEACRDRVIASRVRLTERLTGLGFQVLPSAANFIFARHPERDAASLSQRLRERAVLVRHFRSPRIEQFLRISIGTNAECDALLVALREILASA